MKNKSLVGLFFLVMSFYGSAAYAVSDSCTSSSHYIRAEIDFTSELWEYNESIPFNIITPVTASGTGLWGALARANACRKASSQAVAEMKALGEDQLARFVCQVRNTYFPYVNGYAFGVPTHVTIKSVGASAWHGSENNDAHEAINGRRIDCRIAEHVALFRYPIYYGSNNTLLESADLCYMPKTRQEYIDQYGDSNGAQIYLRDKNMVEKCQRSAHAFCESQGYHTFAFLSSDAQNLKLGERAKSAVWNNDSLANIESSSVCDNTSCKTARYVYCTN